MTLSRSAKPRLGEAILEDPHRWHIGTTVSIDVEGGLGPGHWEWALCGSGRASGETTECGVDRSDQPNGEGQGAARSWALQTRPGVTAVDRSLRQGRQEVGSGPEERPAAPGPLQSARSTQR